MEGDAALLDELLQLLEDPPTPTLALADEPQAWRPPQLPTNPHKRQVACLELELQQLTQQLTRLRHHRISPAREAALTERFKRRRAERECAQLQVAVATHARFLRGLTGAIGSEPVLSLGRGLSGYRMLHRPTRLPLDPTARRREYAMLADESRLRSVVDLLCHETASLNIADDDAPLVPSLKEPYIATELTTDPTGFDVIATFVYAVPTRELAAAARGAWVAIRDSSTRCRAYESTSCDSHIVDPDATTALPVSTQYRVESIEYKNPQDTDFVVGETRSLTLTRQTNDSVVVLWDFVDDDDLHPSLPAADVTRKAVGSCLIRNEMCEDGVERAVCRGIFTRRFELRDGATPGPMLEEFQDRVGRNMQGCELLFRESIIESIEAEEAVYTRVVQALHSTQLISTQHGEGSHVLPPHLRKSTRDGVRDTLDH